ncbi:MAG: crossover junction endodeoxyribonuclease RuvC [Candidatus Tagabacteria bacterium CG09_land_8_20_14_0_10_41_14]|uniref:Crossover junction endodeoxyribonuclease RuvC n=2 Tax=Candidatus Tagaibacteriota TaxID=1817918 RepID=A0A2H0WL67_9BACT|nr:MAG: crossover junction endodeoxyribonuclease RuvC [Candidatus Tagabacteria bacterium CG09_land_8_20_14_0_10_41_14]PJE73206.1 MAG: crossover junction endodeoxyribonuclease RuvC [Candidatus Tagabacteria bacterium CG10_big_fil_rev_8_21_14_0_10_40_13]
MRNEKTTILGIDPGYGRLGYAILKKTPKKEELLEYSCIENPAGRKYHEKISTITQKIEEIIKKFRPSVLAIEKIYFNKNQKTALQVAEVKGIIIHLALKNKMKIIEYTPLQVKIATCGYGKASKNQMIKMVNLLTDLKKTPKHDDTYDAIALCLTCAARNEHLWTKYSI